MDSTADMLERRIPDVVSTEDLPDQLAAEIDFLAGRTKRWIDSKSVGPGVKARALASANDMAAARNVLDRFEPEGASAQELVAATWAVSRCGPTAIAQRLLDVVESIDEEFLVQPTKAGPMPLGPAVGVVGLLRATTGDLDGAIVALRSAAALGDTRAPVWGAISRVELARVLRCATAVTVEADARVSLDEADRALSAARTFLIAGGYRALLRRLNEVAKEPVRGVLVHGRQWTVGFGVQSETQIRSGKGLVVLHHLLVNSHRQVSCAELVRLLDGGDLDGVRALADLDLIRQLEAQEPSSDVTDSLRATFFDDGNRSRVTKLVRRTIAKIGESHALLGRHLELAVRTGHVCRYVQTDGVQVAWTL